MLAVFSVTLNGRKIYLCPWECQNNGRALSTVTLQLQMARMKMNYNLKKWPIFRALPVYFIEAAKNVLNIVCCS